MTPSEFPQHERLTRVLNIYRSAMRRHIAAQWRAKHGDAWFDEVQSYLTEHQQQEIRSTRETLEVQRANGEAALSQEEENEFLLDIATFLEATKSRSDLFGRVLTERETTDKMYAVYQLRNRWAHPPLRDLHKAEVDGAVAYCASILDGFDPAAAEAVRSVANDDPHSPHSDLLLERLDQLRDAIESRSLPTDQLSGMLGQLLESHRHMVEQDGAPTETDDIVAELRALRAEVAASRTRLGDWWRKREQETLALLDRLTGVNRP